MVFGLAAGAALGLSGCEREDPGSALAPGAPAAPEHAGSYQRLALAPDAVDERAARLVAAVDAADAEPAWSFTDERRLEPAEDVASAAEPSRASVALDASRPVVVEIDGPFAPRGVNQVVATLRTLSGVRVVPTARLADGELVRGAPVRVYGSADVRTISRWTSWSCATRMRRSSGSASSSPATNARSSARSTCGSVRGGAGCPIPTGSRGSYGWNPRRTAR